MSNEITSLPKKGLKVLIRQLEETDLDALYSLESDEDVKKFLGGPVSKIRGDWVAGMKKLIGPSCITLAVEATSDSIFAGRASIANYATRDDREIQIVIAKQFWGCRLGKETCRILIDIAFKELNAKNIFGVVHPQNIASRSLLLERACPEFCV